MVNGGQALKVQDENHQTFGSLRCCDRDLNGVRVNPKNTAYRKICSVRTDKDQVKVSEVTKN